MILLNAYESIHKKSKALDSGLCGHGEGDSAIQKWTGGI
jgi:hypothetical protein